MNSHALTHTKTFTSAFIRSFVAHSTAHTLRALAARHGVHERTANKWHRRHSDNRGGVVQRRIQADLRAHGASTLTQMMTRGVHSERNQLWRALKRCVRHALIQKSGDVYQLSENAHATH